MALINEGPPHSGISSRASPVTRTCCGGTRHVFGVRCLFRFASCNAQPRTTMARGSKKSYSSKQKRKASHIEKGYKKRGVSTKTAEKRAWATVNKQDGGAKKKRKSSSKKRSTSKKK